MTTPTANGTQPFAAAARSESAPPVGGSGVGAEAPPVAPPPPPTAVDGRVAEYQRLTDDMAAALKDQAAEIERLRGKPARQPSRVWAKASGLPKRHAVPLCIGATVVGITLGITQCTPRLSEDQVAERATLAAVGQVAPYVDSKIQQVPQVSVISDPFSAYGLELSENAKTAIGWRTDPQTGAVLGLNEKRAEFVARQVRVLSATFKLLELRLTSAGPSELRVTTNVGEGFPLFLPPSAEAPAPATTATSAP